MHSYCFIEKVLLNSRGHYTVKNRHHKNNIIMGTFFIPVDFSSKNQEHVRRLQQLLTALGCNTGSTFTGAYDSAVGAVQNFQTANALPSSGTMSAETIRMLNVRLNEFYRICGELKNDYGTPVEGAEVLIYKTIYSGARRVLLGSGTSMGDGSYCILLAIPDTDLDTRGVLKAKINVTVEIKQGGAVKLTQSNLFVQEKENRFNFLSPLLTCTGKSVYGKLTELLQQYGLATAVNGISKTSLLARTDDSLTSLATLTGIENKTLIKLFVAEVLESKTGISNSIFSSNIPEEVFFAFLHHGVPDNLPSQLMMDEEELSLISTLGEYQNMIAERINIGLSLTPVETLRKVLLTACNTSIIDVHTSTWTETYTTKITDSKSKVASNSPLLEGGVSVLSIINVAGTTLSSTQKTQVANLFASNIHDFEGFLDALGKLSNTYGAANVDSLILTFRISRVVRNYPALVSEVKSQYNAYFSQYDASFMAAITQNNWLALINSLSCPADFESREAYTQFVYENAQKLYPQVAAALQLELKQDSSSRARDIMNVLLTNRNRNLLVDRIADFHMDTALLQDAEFMQKFKTFQRVYRISPSPQVTAVLLENGITNAAQVYYMGVEQFAANFENRLNRQEIRNVYSMSTAIFAGAITSFANVNSALQLSAPHVLQNYNIQEYIEKLKDDVPNIEELFGEQEHCACSHDTSVYSPAAYLSDILQFLGEQKIPETTQSILDYLKERRADICKINLNAQNTSTLLPYIDLMCEVLEVAVIRSMNGSYTRPDSTCQSTLTTEELCAAPEHILQQNGKTAYDTVKKSIFSMFAPFDLEQTESRAFLAKQGVARDELMELFQKGVSVPTNADIAAEYFGLTNLERDIVTACSTNVLTNTLEKRNTAWTKLTTQSNIQRMSLTHFMQDTGLSFYEMLDIYRADWLKLSNQNLITDCSFKDREITSSANGFDRTHRFIRLWRKSGWKMWELNLLLKNSNVTGYVNENTDNLNAVALYKLYQFSRQQKMLGLSCESLLAFYGNINTSDLYENGKKQPCLYNHLFLNDANNPANTYFEAVKADGGDSVILDSEDYDEMIAAGLSIGREDCSLLKLKYKGIDKTIRINCLTWLTWLSWLYRHATLSKTLNVPLLELSGILELTGKYKKEAYTPDEIDSIIETVASIKESKISVFEYEYLAKNETDTLLFSEAAPVSEQLTECIDRLAKEIDNIGVIRRPVLADFEISNNENTKYRDLFLKYLSRAGIFNNSITREKFVDIIEGKSGLNEDDVRSWITAYAPEMLPDLSFYSVQDGKLSAEMVKKCYSNAVYWLNSKYVRESEFASTVQNLIAKFLDLSSVIVKAMLSNKDWEKGVNLQEFVLEHIRQEQPLDSNELRKILLRLHKASLFIKKIDICPDEINHLLMLWRCYNQDGTLTASDFLNMEGIIALHKKYATADGITLLNVLATNKPVNDIVAVLCKLTGWNSTDLNTLVEPAALNMTQGDFLKPQTYTRLERCMEMLGRLKTGAATIISGSNGYSGWRESKGERAQNESIRNALKAQYDRKTWLKELEIIQKPIREAKVHALSCYLIAVSQRNPNQNALPIKDKSDLYSHFLLDPEMSADMKTSRIVQATCSVQLFIQRILLSLEKVTSGALTERKWKQWEWMKRYRLWEAGFKVFLYPENYIEPELRDDKSPFFKEMEDELNQSDIAHEHAETVFVNYLQKLQEVSNLMVAGIYQEKIGETKYTILHVIGRSRTAPYQYWYRHYNEVSKTWSCWEKIELDIKGETVAPVVYSQKLYLFWMNVVEKIENNNHKKDDNKDPDKYTEIQLEWSEYKSKKWLPVKVSRKKHIHYGHFPSMSYSLVAVINKNDGSIGLTVYCTTVDKTTESSYKKYGEFRFNGDVLNVVSYLAPFKEEERGVIKILAGKMGYDEMPEFNTGDASTYSEKLLASRLYSKDTIVKIDNGNLLSTSNTNPNIVPALHNGDMAGSKDYPFFYQDSKRTFFVKMSNNTDDEEYTLYPFYHPVVNKLTKVLNITGIGEFFNRIIQMKESSVPNDYKQLGGYKKVMYASEIHELVSFSSSSACSQYNWELFFHAPLYIACKLSQNQKFEEAMRWFHYIFNPTDASAENAPQKFWLTKPFFLFSDNDMARERIVNILKGFDTDIKNATAQWLNDPFNPHLVARTRISAFQKTVVMKYLDNLINWADQLFRQDTQESNSEATQLYVLAGQILGKRPVTLPEKETVSPVSDTHSFNNAVASAQQDDFVDSYGQHIAISLQKSLHKTAISHQVLLGKDALFAGAATSGRAQSPTGTGSGNTIMTTNTLYPPAPSPIPAGPTDTWLSYLCSGDSGHGNGNNNNDDEVPTENSTTITVQGEEADVPHITYFDVLLAPRFNSRFCVPYNDRMIQYWDKVEDRLFKLRHCMNLEGIVRELPLFAPPIDPALLVKAAAAGLSIADALNDITAPQPHYRFRVMLQKAVEFTNEVKQLGEKLLAALEKRDAETLSMVRNAQETNMQQAVRQVRQLQIEEAKRSIEALTESIKSAEARKTYYESRELMNRLETTAYGLNEAATVMTDVVAVGYTAAAIAKLIPNFSAGGAGVMGSPMATADFTGGDKISGSISATMAALSQISQALDKQASLLLTKSGYQRRKEEWDFQAKMATMEIGLLNKQQTAAEIRLMVAEKELENAEIQIEQSKSINIFYTEKFTGEQLYNWMITELSKLYFDAYKLAYDMAKKAERCYRHELGIYDNSSAPIIDFGNWDSLKNGLLSGDRLMYNLHQLDAAYLNSHKRTLELTKHISLAQMFPAQLLKLITDKTVDIDLKELLFDMDYPGHYMRRIKSVSVTIPNVTGPYTNVSFMLTLQSAKIRKDATGTDYDETPLNEDPRFVYQSGGAEYICTSSARNDSGMFELNFGDERYLPFENAGAISRWKLSLPAGCNQFDVSTIADVVLHINYTALYDGNLAQKATTALAEKLPQAGGMIFSLKQDFPNAWNQMSESVTEMSFTIAAEHLPFFLRSTHDLNVTACSVVLTSRNGDLANTTFYLKGIAVELAPSQLVGDCYLYSGTVKNIPENTPVKGAWTAQFGGTGGVPVSDIVDLWIGFELSAQKTQ